MERQITKKILVIDDEPQLCEMLADALSDEQTQVSIAGSAAEAIERAVADRPDIIVTDICLGDASGLDVLDRLRDAGCEAPAVVITGRASAQNLTDASRRRPVELMTKPLDIHRLRETISNELGRLSEEERYMDRARHLRDLARTGYRKARRKQNQLQSTCARLTGRYRALSRQAAVHQAIMRYELDMIAAKTDDDVFRSFFRTFVRKCGPVYGVAMVCDSNAELRISGRFGVPKPDSLEFCRALADPVIDRLLNDPIPQTMDCGEEADLFDPRIGNYLPGLTVLAVPLIPAPGEMIGLVLLYRKGEQPFGDDAFEMAEMFGYPTAVAVRRND
jgi:DNA-binding response OmpR family regulator